MAGQIPTNKTVTRCPHCGSASAVGREHVGKSARCPKCGRAFVITEAAAPGAAPAAAKPKAAAPVELAPAAVPQRAPDDRTLCPVCQSAIGTEEAIACPECKTVHHWECWQYNGGCGMYGCEESPPTEGLGSLDVPASFWGQENKQCPACGQTILAAAVRCRHCGATFASARPQDSTEYATTAARKMSQPGLRKMGIVLLVLAILPCAAPVAAIIGLVWYAQRRKDIDSLPAMHAGLCKIAVGLAVGHTALLLLILLLYGIFGGG